MTNQRQLLPTSDCVEEGQKQVEAHACRECVWNQVVPAINRLCDNVAHEHGEYDVLVQSPHKLARVASASVLLPLLWIPVILADAVATVPKSGWTLKKVFLCSMPLEPSSH